VVSASADQPRLATPDSGSSSSGQHAITVSRTGQNRQDETALWQACRLGEEALFALTYSLDAKGYCFWSGLRNGIRMTRIETMAAFLLAGGCCAADSAAYAPASAYQTQVVEGWTVHVHGDLLTEPEDLGGKTLRELEFQLHQVTRAVSADALAALRKVAIWVEAKSSVTGMCYHPSRQWLRDNGFNPAKAKGIELGNPRNFLSWTRHQFWMVFHELAHAYHDQVLGWDNADIKAAFSQAQEGGTYDLVLKYSGQRARAYAVADHKEYFAELSEAFFGCNDFYPFVQAELKEHDPLGYQTVRRAWGVGTK